MDSVKKKILIIDDNKEITELVERILEGTEFELVKSNNGQEGIHIAREQRPDAILLDIMMPELDGFTTCRFLRQIPETRDIPVIYLTGKETEKGHTIALKSGASDYIVKPFNPKDLLDRLRRVIPS